MTKQILPHADALRSHKAPLDMSPEQFREIGHKLVDQIADHFAGIAGQPVSPGESPDLVRRDLRAERRLPESGSDPAVLLNHAAQLLFAHSTFNGHPRFFGYITSSAAPLGALADLLAASVNPNVGAWKLSPAATEIEAQTIRWIAEFIGYSPACGGLLVSGGNMANFVCFLAARAARAPWDIRKLGLRAPEARPLRCYASTETHTWIQKAADLFGLGTDSVRWIPTDAHKRMDLTSLARQLNQDRGMETSRFWSSELRDRSAPESSIPCRNWPPSVAKITFGSTWTPPTEASPPKFPKLPPSLQD